MAHAMGSTIISFGLVTIPVKIYPATSSDSVCLNQLHAKCGGRVRQQLYCPVDDQVLASSDVVKEFEVGKDQYVQFSAEELKSLQPAKFEHLGIERFVPANQIDPVLIEKSYYLGPQKGAHRAFHLLTKAMVEAHRVAVGTYMLRGRVHLAALRPYQKGMLLSHLVYSSEVRDYEDIDIGPDEGSPGEQKLAAQLVDSLAGDFDHSAYRDLYSDAVRAAAKAKSEGKTVIIAPTAAPAEQVIDLFEALKHSLKPTKGKKKTPKSKKGAKGSA